MYQLRFDPAQKILHVTTEGFWSLGTLAAFSATALAQGAALRLRHGAFAVLADGRRFPIQAADVAKGFELFLHKGVQISSAPFAIVVPTVLGKLQAERVLNTPNCRIFIDWDEATAWLEEVWPQRRAA